MENETINIRLARMDELDVLMGIFDRAKQFMRSAGNHNQWINGYPQRELIAGEIRDGHCYVCETGDHGTCAVFCMIAGDDPTYSYIEGAWLSDRPYVTIHRLGSDGRVRGIGKACFDFARRQGVNIRVDTHADNRLMQNLVTGYGFKYCGVIYLENGDPRLAYELLNGFHEIQELCKHPHEELR